MATAGLTSTLTINAAFFHEIKEVNQDLWKQLTDLRALCLDIPTMRARFSHFAEMLEELRDQLAMHFALEEAYGYFEDPVTVAPKMSERAFELRAEHPKLYQAISELADRAEAIRRHAHSSLVLTSVLHEFQSFDQTLRDHEASENELILDECDADIGVGD